MKTCDHDFRAAPGFKCVCIKCYKDEEVAELETKLARCNEIREMNLLDCRELEAKIERVRECKQYVVELHEIGKLAPVLRWRDVLDAL